MSELLNRIQTEIHDRLEASRAAVEESVRLEAALAVLSQAGASPAPAPAPAAAAPQPRRRKPAAPRPRAARGANRTAVLDILEQRPGVGVAELASASGVKKPVLYGLLSKLVEEGAIVKEDLPGGTVGYALPKPAEDPGWKSAPVPEAVAETPPAEEPAAESEPAEPEGLAEAA